MFSVYNAYNDLLMSLLASPYWMVMMCTHVYILVNTRSKLFVFPCIWRAPYCA